MIQQTGDRSSTGTAVASPQGEQTNLSPEARDYQRDGLFLAPPMISQELIDRVIPRMDAIINEEYETGIPPLSRTWKPGDDPEKLRKVDQTHLSDRTVYELVSQPAIGEWAAKLTGAKMIQVWATQLLLKPTGTKFESNVGWHQDQQYWQKYFAGECFTAWVAISDVKPESGPMRFVRGTHKCGLIKSGNFHAGNLDALRQTIETEIGMPWEEVPAVLPPGGVSFHHRYVIHGSGPNTAPWPRRSFAIHLRTENSGPAPGTSHYYTQHLDDPKYCPILYDAR